MTEKQTELVCMALSCFIGACTASVYDNYWKTGSEGELLLGELAGRNPCMNTSVPMTREEAIAVLADCAATVTAYLKDHVVATV